MQRLCFRILMHSSSKNLQSINFTTQIDHTEKLKTLSQVTEKMNLRLSPSILIGQDSSTQKKLSFEEKVKLGLFIPKSPFNARMSKALEYQYMPKITSELYHLQKQKLQTNLRILQNNLFLQSGHTTLDHYINIIYKDIYARYLISKNVGIEWEGFFANTGALNASSTSDYDQIAKYRQNFSILLDFIQNNVHQIRESPTIGLYSYYDFKFVHPNSAGVEKIKRLGHYIKEELTSFGKYQKQFSMLQEKNSKVYLMILVQRLEKIINPNAICVNSDDKFIMLKKYTSEADTNIEFLITSLDSFKKHEAYFKNNKYERHNTFDGKYLLGMKCMNVPIISEIEGYSRSPNAYIVNSNCHVGDFQRVQAHGLQHFPPFIDEHGHIELKKSGNLIMLENKNIDDKFKKQQTQSLTFKESYVVVDEELSFHLMNSTKIATSLQRIFIKEGIQFMDFYEIFEDEVYFHQTTKQILNFRIGKKYSIEIPEQNIKEILKGFQRQNAVITESKIKIESLNPGKKPKEKRQFRKTRKLKLQEITQHFSLADSLSQISSISISSLSQNSFILPIFLKNSKLVPYENILDQSQIELLLQGKLSQVNLKDEKYSQFQCRMIYANEELIKALLYLRNLHNSKDIFNVIIEPQSQTEQLIPHAVHLNYLINKTKTRGRKINLEVKNNISLIKLHPTLSSDSKSLPIKQLIEGVVKSNDKQQYGLGLEALRLWCASNDNYLGDRSIKDYDVNKELQHSQNIRTIFWNLLSILPNQIKDVKPQLYLSKFVLDMIDCFIVNMEECYKTMNIYQAYLQVNDFFTHILNEIYVKNIRERVIAFPNLKENQQHFFVIRRILELVAVTSPLFPFTAYHISKRADLTWPSILNHRFYETIPLHLEMLKTRVKVVNKLRLNRLQHAQIYCENLKDAFSARDLQLFFNVKQVTFEKPDIEDRACSLELRRNNPIINGEKLIIYASDNHCIRCEPRSKQTDHLCQSCISYLQEQISQPLAYFTQKTHKKLE